MRVIVIFAGVLAGVAAVQPAAPEATSLLGTPLTRPPIRAEARTVLEANLADAKRAYEANRDDADAIIWLGRRTAYLGRYRDAIEIFSEGVRKHPGDPRMYRHRGHRYITIRELDLAIDDLSRAATLSADRDDEVEPDGQPNARKIPTSTLKTNIYYHLGLAHYLKGEFEDALAAYRQCLDLSTNPDMLTATTHWLYMTLRRLDRPGEARQVLEPISASMDIIENTSYHRLLMMYKGSETSDALLASVKTGERLDAVTIAYGVANWHLYNGRRPQAMELFRKIVDGHADQWPAFGYVAAEAELARAKEPAGGQ